MPRALLVSSNDYNPWFNLALESLLMERVEQGLLNAVLYLWQNDNTVVIGRNQNAWAECNTGRLEADGGRLARRSTGGGAVYHDLGNLNFSIILPRSAFSIDRNFELLLAVVESQGISAVRSGRNDILVNGCKFSGNAFSLKRKAGLHHGTLMVQSDYERLARYLTVSPDKLKAKGVSSVSARVVNLQSVEPSLSVNKLKVPMENLFVRFFCQEADWQIERCDDFVFRSDPRLQVLEAHYTDWSWRYGETLAFDAAVSKRFLWGQVQLGFLVKEGRVGQVKVYSDALDSDYISSLPQRLMGCRFHSSELAGSLLAFQDSTDIVDTPRRQMTEDLASLIKAQNW